MGYYLTQDQIQILKEGATAVCINGVWKWLKDGKPCGRNVNKLIKHGLMSATYYRGGRASAWINDLGREILREIA